MDDQEIERACETLRRLLRDNDCNFALIRGEIKRGRVEELKLYPERPGIMNGKVVAPA